MCKHIKFELHGCWCDWAIEARGCWRQIALQDVWASRRLLIGLRDASAVSRHIRLPINHLCDERQQ